MQQRPAVCLSAPELLRFLPQENRGQEKALCSFSWEMRRSKRLLPKPGKAVEAGFQDAIQAGCFFSLWKYTGRNL